MKLSRVQVAGWVLTHPFTDPALATAIAWAESGGDTEIVRPAELNRLGGRDRGLWQINSKAHPTVSDAQALDLASSTAYVLQLTNNGRDWSCWSYGAPGRCRPERSRTDLDLAGARADVERAKQTLVVFDGSGKPLNFDTRTAYDMLGLGDSPLAQGAGKVIGATDKALEPVVGAIDAIKNGVGGLVDLASKLLRVVTSAEFWRRAGLVALGVAAVAVAIVVLVRGSLFPAPAKASVAAAAAAA